MVSHKKTKKRRILMMTVKKVASKEATKQNISHELNDTIYSVADES